jgi:hypothetical protein
MVFVGAELKADFLGLCKLRSGKGNHDRDKREFIRVIPRDRGIYIVARETCKILKSNFHENGIQPSKPFSIIII